MPNAAPTFRIHSLAQAVAVLRAAAAARCRVRLLVGDYLGWAACAALRDAALASVPAARADWLYHPGGRAALAALALRQGAALVVWPATDRRHAALAALARQTGGRLVASPRLAADLAQASDPLGKAQGILARRRAKPALPRQRRSR